MAKLGMQTQIELPDSVFNTESGRNVFSVGVVVSLLDFGFTLWELNQINSHNPWQQVNN